MDIHALYQTPGSYHQFDTMALPGDMKISGTWFEAAAEKMKSGLKSMFGLQEKVIRPTQLETKQLCLEFYLNLYRYSHILTSGQFDETLAINKYVEGIQHILTSMAETTTTISGVPTMLVTADSNVDKQWYKIRMVSNLHKRLSSRSIPRNDPLNLLLSPAYNLPPPSCTRILIAALLVLKHTCMHLVFHCDKLESEIIS